jgi:hypothetical protein
MCSRVPHRATCVLGVDRGEHQAVSHRQILCVRHVVLLQERVSQGGRRGNGYLSLYREFLNAGKDGCFALRTRRVRTNWVALTRSTWMPSLEGVAGFRLEVSNNEVLGQIRTTDDDASSRRMEQDAMINHPVHAQDNIHAIKVREAMVLLGACIGRDSARKMASAAEDLDQRSIRKGCIFMSWGS